MPNLLKLISLNVEGHKHFDLQMAFLKAESPDVLCLQEVLESDFEFIKSSLLMNGYFAPMVSERIIDKQKEEVLEPRGIAIFAKLPFEKSEAHYYYGNSNSLYEWIDGVTPQEKIQRAILWGSILKEEKILFFGTTHFTWSKGGIVDGRQRKDLKALLKKLSTIPEIIFCGDFNAPRGGEIFSMIAKKYKDNIPLEYFTSIYPNLHRKGDLQLMVDGLFSTPGYQITNVRLKGGVSDHYAIIADIN